MPSYKVLACSFKKNIDVQTPEGPNVNVRKGADELDDLIFEREKTRRDIQEALNAVDEAIAAESPEEQEKADIKATVQLAVFVVAKPRYVDLVIDRTREKKDA